VPAAYSASRRGASTLPIQIIPTRESVNQLALLELLSNAGQQGVQNFRGFQVQERQAYEQRALADVLGGRPGTALPPGVAGPPTPPTEGMIPGLSPAEARTLVDAGAGDELLSLGLARRFPKPAAPVSVAPGGTLFDPTTGQPLFTAPAAPDMSTSQREAQALGYDLSTPEGAQGYAQWRQSLTRPPAAPTVNLPAQETEREKALGKATGDRLSAIADEARNNRRARSAIGMLDNLMEAGVQTGPGTAWRQSIRDLTGLELGDLSGPDAFRAVANQLVLQAQVAQAGPQTDSDRAVIATTLPQIGTSDRANDLVVDMLEAQSKRLDEELTLERRLIEQDGLSVSEAQARVAQEFADKPVFDERITAQARQLAAGSQVGGTDIGTMSLDQLRATAMDDAALARMSPEQRAALAARLRAGR